MDSSTFRVMPGRKRGPYRQYLRQDEPFQSQALQKKLRRSNKECKLTPDLPLATEFADEFDNEEIDLHQNAYRAFPAAFLSLTWRPVSIPHK